MNRIYFRGLFIGVITACLFQNVKAQNVPVFGNEIDVTINGYTSHVMEPFISYDGNTLFFNNLNDGINTKLFYAAKVNDSTFNYVGEVNGTGQAVQPYLDAVPDIDSLNNFYWTSTRNYPASLNNLFYGVYNAGNVTDSGRVYGDFNMNIPGWLVMDHGISASGDYLYYNNARFDSATCTGICETNMGVAQKVNDSTFNKLPNSTAIMKSINDSNYNFYAPCITSDDLELYFTRYPRDTITIGTLFEICVAVRNSSLDTFSTPVVLFSDSIANLIEAPTLTKDKQIMYYHVKTPTSHKVVMRYRDNTTGVYQTNFSNNKIRVYPNPMKNGTVVEFNEKKIANYSLLLMDNLGRGIRTYKEIDNNRLFIARDNLKSGLYYIQVSNNKELISTSKLIIE
jgi:hypothetical protein